MPKPLTFKQFLTESVKAAFRYDEALGDRQAVTRVFLNDKQSLTRDERLLTQQFFRKWKASKGALPIFELKHQTSKLAKEGIPYKKPLGTGEMYKTMLYTVQVSHKSPAIHLAVVREAIKNARGQDCNLFVWVRIFNDYNKYYDWLSSKRSK